MSTFRTPLSVLHERSETHGTWTALKVPVQDDSGTSWKSITFPEFCGDIDKCAAYWAGTLSKGAGQSRLVVGLWLEGSTYSDLLHIWAVMRAGHIPQLISVKLTDSSVVLQVLKAAGAGALIYDARFEGSIADCPLPKHPAKTAYDTVEDVPLAPVWTPSDPDDVVMIYHTSGSTSGIPKSVPLLAGWMESLFNKLFQMERMFPSSHEQQMGISVGSFSHVGNGTLLLESICRGDCFILPTRLPYPTSELRQVIKECGLTRLNMFPSILSGVIRMARQDESLLLLLKQLDYIAYGGGVMDPTQEAWARSQGLRLLNIFASTEVGIMLASDISSNPELTEASLKPMPGFYHEFIPVSGVANDGNTLLELVVPPDSPDCPVASLRDPQDGKFHTGDLFIETSPGQYLTKGRNDDWIKMEMALRCDTSAIEGNAMDTCGDDIIGAVVVVGEGRPSPAMVVELKDDCSLTASRPGNESTTFGVEQEILRRTRPFHTRRYMHERIDDARLILVVPLGSLPRTAAKGNIRRKEVERMLKAELDRMYSEVKGDVAETLDAKQSGQLTAIHEVVKDIRS
ncbi:hypothetical protein HIM_06190 [Hirsutella minnesotensis 3608]|uniref:AMP-dependent synthetase/ligase domain-containing protein n=1 Tax=Hirsutella minnesotensis 3608 TaxID=1043627 RepID=A0A0F7ZNU9_9HYPO|nr:hypothetical protein HIM_06190 [Hirsutella minnesotensis 3608]